MLTFAYMVGGWVKANTYVSKILEITRTFDILGETFLIISQPHLNFRTNFRLQNRFLHRKVDKIRAKPYADCITCTNPYTTPATINKIFSFKNLKRGHFDSNLLGVGGFQEILRNLQGGSSKILCLLTRWVGGSKKGPKHACVIYEWSLEQYHYRKT